VTTLQI
jgi:hypothetical protein